MVTTMALLLVDAGRWMQESGLQGAANSHSLHDDLIPFVLHSCHDILGI